MAEFVSHYRQLTASHENKINPVRRISTGFAYD